ncbi:fibronectin type III domain-containing protein [Amycolatopsis sp. 195334CR]|uniref:fibronectin type III domain-containing protein n=1 Tax=Amycolatopsis sp. 195334CR TaxID=2814588 RepID=UPI001A8D36FB|nr:fibronectin type III domain-containing protein [Amycolatopsis sp. 195334CR]MBN6039078.1 fibronectin type III domain-containing protein [Amycolatopsis sp. 195334CR]
MTSKLRQRLPAALLVAACAGTVAVAVSGAGEALGGLDFAPSGHWVGNPGLDLLFHVNGASATVDTQAGLPLDPGDRVYQGDSSVFVVGGSRIREFGKSSLEVENEVPAPTGEPAVGVEAPGGPYLVFRKAGTVVRLGERPATIRAGTDLGDPVATPEGALWLHRMATGVVCTLAVDADQVSCPTVTPMGHSGELTVAGSAVAFVDKTADTVQTVTAQGLGTPVNLGVDLPHTATIANADTAGRVAVVDPGARQLHLIDTAGLGTGSAAAGTVTVPLPDGEFTSAEPSGSSVVLLDRRNNAVHTYTSEGKPQAVTPVPPETGAPRLSRGADGRVYVDGDQGGHVMVVDEHGAVSQVPLTDAGKPGGIGDPQAPPPEPPPDQGSQAGPPPGNPPAQAQPAPKPAPNPQSQPGPKPQPEPNPQSGPKPQPQPQPQPGPKPQPQPQPQPKPPKPLPASPPGAATNLTTAVDGTSVQFTWGAAAPNGGEVTAYHVSWKPGNGSLTKPGSARSATLSGLKPGTSYTVTIIAENSAGQGTAASAKVAIPGPSVTVSRGKPSEYDGCGPPCHKMRIRASGLEPDTEYEFNPFSNHPTWENPGSSWTTDENGEVDFQNIDFGEPGYEVWVVIEETGTTSKHYTWPG